EPPRHEPERRVPDHDGVVRLPHAGRRRPLREGRGLCAVDVGRPELRRAAVGAYRRLPREVPAADVRPMARDRRRPLRLRDDAPLRGRREAGRRGGLVDAARGSLTEPRASERQRESETTLLGHPVGLRTRTITEIPAGQMAATSTPTIFVFLLKDVFGAVTKPEPASIWTVDPLRSPVPTTTA